MKQSRSALIFIFVTVMIDMIGLGIIIPVLPDLLRGFTGNNLETATLYSGWLMFAYSVMQFLFSPVIGGLSDRFGRKPVLILSLLGLGFDHIFTALAPALGWLFVARIISGMAGASYTTATAYIADISTNEDRAKNFGLMGAAWGLGFIIGPVIGGLVGSLGPRAPFYVAAILALGNSLFGLLVLPESLPASSRRPFDWKRANPLGTAKQLGKYPLLIGLFVAFFIYSLAGQVYPSTWPFFTTKELHWRPFQIGTSLAFFGLLGAIVQGGLTGAIIKRTGEFRAVLLGLGLNILGFTLFSFASESWMMFAISVPAAVGGFGQPALQSIMSKEVPATEQGELQGALASLMSISAIVGPVLHSSCFAYFSSPGAFVDYPGAAFMLAAIMTTAALLICLKSLKHSA